MYIGKKQKKTSTRLSYHSNVCWIGFDDDDIFVCWAIVFKKELVGWHHEFITERMTKLQNSAHQWNFLKYWMDTRDDFSIF